MQIAVFCSANDIDASYNEPALEFARLLARGGHTLIWGGSDKGLMRKIADEVQANGGKLIGVSVEFLKHLARPNTDEMIVAPTIGERKAIMLERADALAVLPGGLGTLAEASEIVDLKKLGMHKKPIVVLNTNNFYKGLQIQLQAMRSEGFITQEVSSLVSFAETPGEAFRALTESKQSRAGRSA